MRGWKRSSSDRTGARAALGIPALLRAEGAAAFIAGLVAYAQIGQGWALFAVLFLAPDLAMAGYAFGPRTGAATYNAAHTYVLPFALGVVGFLAAGASSLAVAVALIWAAHIAFDRMLGYGLKLPEGFGHTHLGRIGKDRDAA